MIVDIVDKYLTDDNNPIKNLRLKKFGSHFVPSFSQKKSLQLPSLDGRFSYAF